ncbi:MAG: NAD-dependent epimerase/dehydratase family protein [Planctomycetota bacterium]|nr:MAG: NAD-dependent epimerase/dehydratase family protein [Planctomycetota bacterium]RLS90787.1 MAG: NAD-dependent epimerase/dehydratase family protein [Planctomycetota bacterium]
MGTVNKKMDGSRVLITGITGFAGSYLAEHLQGYAGEIHGISRSEKWPENIPSHLQKIPLHTSNFKDSVQVASVLKKINPTHIYHLAGFAQTGKSFTNTSEAWAANLGAPQILYDAIKKSGITAKVLFAGSGLIYGTAKYNKEIKTESSELMPQSPYASSKAAADLLSYQIWVNDGIEIIRARPFNHIGPRQSIDFAMASFSKQIAEIELLKKPPIIKTGSLSAFRDLTDVRDTVKAYAGLMEHGKPGEAYNIGSGKNIRISDALKILVSFSNTPNLKIEEELPSSSSQKDFELLVGIDKLNETLSWKPIFSLDETLSDTLNYWRQIIATTLQNPKESK